MNKEKTVHTRNGEFSRCVLMGKKDADRELVEILESAFGRVDVFENLERIRPSDEFPSVSLLVVSSSFPGGVNRQLIETAKARVRPGSTVCLVDHVDPENEIELRAAGITFLGTFGSFAHHAKEILGNALGKPFG